MRRSSGRIGVANRPPKKARIAAGNSAESVAVFAALPANRRSSGRIGAANRPPQRKCRSVI